MSQKHSTLAFLLMCYYIPSVSIGFSSAVYNMRIATVTSERAHMYERLGIKLPSILVGTFLHQSRKRKPDFNQTIDGPLFNYIYSFDDFYVRLDAACARVHETGPQTCTTHTQMDDLLFSAGYRHTINKKLHNAYSFLFGVPTHKYHGLEYFQFGTGHCGAGVQLDGIYAFDTHERSSFLAAVRFIHFFNAKAIVPLVTKRICVDLSIGNLVDILLAYHRKWARHHVEIGYNPEFVYKVGSCPPLEPALPSRGIRSTWYSTYRYIFVIKKHPMGAGVGVSYGFDHLPKHVGLKRIIAVWGSYGVNF